MAKKLHIGDIVSVYQDPITKKQYEGKAKLVKFLDRQERDTAYWTVQFLEDVEGDTYPRWIDVQ